MTSFMMKRVRCCILHIECALISSCFCPSYKIILVVAVVLSKPGEFSCMLLLLSFSWF